jgi:FkbM family methyltransferase
LKAEVTWRRRAVRRLRDWAWLVNGWPYTTTARRPGVTAERLVSTAARRSPVPFTFVQVGSNDGRTDDPVFPTVMQTEVRGLLVEPVPELFERLQATYAGKRGLTLVQSAVAEEEGRREFHWLPPAPGDPTWSDQIGSLSRDVILGHAADIPDVADRVITLSVPCRTLASLVAEHALTRLDLLHIDAEGHDLAILRSIDFTAPWAPRFVLYEQKHLGADRPAALALLHAAGYSVVSLGDDVFAFRGLEARWAPFRGRHRRGRGNIGSANLLYLLSGFLMVRG